MDAHVYTKSTRVICHILYALGPIFGMFLGIVNIHTSLVAAIMVFILSIVLIVIAIKDIKAGTLTSMIRVDETGLTFTCKTKMYHMAWQHVIWVGYYFNCIVFSTTSNRYILKQRPNYKSISDNLIFFQLGPGVMQEILKYWHGPIINRWTKNPAAEQILICAHPPIHRRRSFPRGYPLMPQIYRAGYRKVSMGIGVLHTPRG